MSNLVFESRKLELYWVSYDPFTKDFPDLGGQS